MQTLNLKEQFAVGGGDNDGNAGEAEARAYMLAQNANVTPGYCGAVGTMAGIAAGLITTGVCTLATAGLGLVTGACAVAGTVVGGISGVGVNSSCQGVAGRAALIIQNQPDFNERISGQV